MSKAVFKCDLTPSPKYGRRQLWVVPLDEIEPWGANPPMRTEDFSLRDLKARYDGDTGQATPGHAVRNEDNHKFRLFDAHRRFELAKKEGFATMELIVWLDVVVRSPKFDTLFDMINGGNRNVNMRERIGLVLDAHPLAGGKLAIKFTEDIKRVLDSDAMELFRANNQPKSAVQVGKGLIKDFQAHKLIDDNADATRRYVSAYYLWQHRYGIQEAIKLWRTAYNKLTELGDKRGAAAMINEAYECIENDRPLPSLMAFASRKAIKRQAKGLTLVT